MEDLPYRSPYAASGAGTFHADRNNSNADGPKRGSPSGPTSGAPIEPLYPEQEGVVGERFSESVAVYMDHDRSALVRAGALLAATVLAPAHLLESGGEAILNAPRNAHLAGSHILRGLGQKYAHRPRLGNPVVVAAEALRTAVRVCRPADSAATRLSHLDQQR